MGSGETDRVSVGVAARAMCTSCGRWASCRPSRKPRRLSETAVPLSVIASSIRSGERGRAPSCTAMPTPMMLAVVDEPNASLATAVKSAQCWSVGADASGDLGGQSVGCGCGEVGVADVTSGRRHRGRSDHDRSLARCRQRLGEGTDELVQHEEEVRFTDSHPVARRLLDRQTQVAHDGPRLLGEADLVEPAHAEPVEHGGGADDLGDGDDAGAADPGDANGEVVGRHRTSGAGRGASSTIGRARRRGRSAAAASSAVSAVGRRRTRSSASTPARRVGVDRDEGGAVAVETRVVEVARRLVDRGLATERRVDRLHRQAVAHPSAVAAAFADPVVDRDPLRRRRREARACASAAVPPRTAGRG